VILRPKILPIALVIICVVSACGEKDPNSNTGKIASATSMSLESNAVIQDFPVAYISRPLLGVENQTPVISPRTMNIFEPGASLILKDRAIASAMETNISDRAFVTDGSTDAIPLYDVRDVESDTAGTQLVFSLRGPFDPDLDIEEQPSWNIWLFDLKTDELRRIIDSNTIAEAGHDRDPHFLADGRIVFTSNRQRQSRAILLDEGRPQFAALDEDRREQAFVLHTINSDGTDLEQITFNQSHDQDPTLLTSGKLVFSRWDNVPGRNSISLYRANPDGSQLERLYGYHSLDSGRDGSEIVFLDPRETEDGRILVLAQLDDGPVLGGDLLVLDVENFVEHDQPTFNSMGSTESGQTSPLDAIVNLSAPSLRGRFASAYPLFDNSNRLLVSWSQCRLLESEIIVPCTEARLATTAPAPMEAAPLFGIWVLNLDDETQQPVVPPTEGMVFTEAIVMSPRPTPNFIMPLSSGNSTSQVLSQDTQALIDEGVGILHLQSVYDLDGVDAAIPNLSTVANPVLTPAAERPAVFLRLVKPVSLPDRELVNLPGSAFGRSRGELMRDIVGYTIIHPDGSVLVKIPADVPLALNILDLNGRRISPRHRNWLQVRPGEVLTCSGCHSNTSEQPHGRPDAEPPSINSGGPFDGLDPSFIVNSGETMAEAYARNVETPSLSFDLVFEDLWTNESQRPKDTGFSYRYQDLETAFPVSNACNNNWTVNCRATINYESIIHPLWSVARNVIDIDGITILEKRTCIECHTALDELSLAQVPIAQLNLTDGASTDQNDHFNSYRELLFNDAEQTLVDGALVDFMEQVFDSAGNPIFELDADGNLLLDINDQPTPVLRTITVTPSMSTNGAHSSSGFFDLFSIAGSHTDYLSPAELRLISEWLDIGGQYYNNPFEVPQ
jgi:hypothetical protein